MSSFISTQFLVLDSDCFFDASFNKFVFFVIPLFYYYTNLISSIICCLSSGDMYLFLSAALFTSSYVSSSDNSLVNFFETLAILSVILLPRKSLVASAVF